MANGIYGATNEYRVSIVDAVTGNPSLVALSGVNASILLGYTGGATDPSSITYKQGTTTIGVYDLVYDGSGRLTSVTRSA